MLLAVCLLWFSAGLPCWSLVFGRWREIVQNSVNYVQLPNMGNGQRFTACGITCSSVIFQQVQMGGYPIQSRLRVPYPVPTDGFPHPVPMVPHLVLDGAPLPHLFLGDGTLLLRLDWEKTCDQWKYYAGGEATKHGLTYTVVNTE